MNWFRLHFGIAYTLFPWFGIRPTSRCSLSYRLHARHGALPAGPHPPPHPVSVRQKSPGPLHRLLDAESLRPLGGLAAARVLPPAPDDRAPQSHSRQQQEGAGSSVQVCILFPPLPHSVHVDVMIIPAHWFTMIHFVPLLIPDPPSTRVGVGVQDVPRDLTLASWLCFALPTQCVCHPGGGGVHGAGSPPERHPGHAGVCLWEVPAQESPHLVRRHRNPSGLCGPPSQSSCKWTEQICWVFFFFFFWIENAF